MKPKSTITPAEEKVIQKAFVSVLWNLSMSENNNKYMHDMQAEYYKGMVTTAVCGIMAISNVSWGRAMIMLDNILPDNCVDLRLVTPLGWHKVLDYGGRIDRQACETYA